LVDSLAVHKHVIPVVTIGGVAEAAVVGEVHPEVVDPSPNEEAVEEDELKSVWEATTTLSDRVQVG
jgi:hypothetical protein